MPRCTGVLDPSGGHGESTPADPGRLRVRLAIKMLAVGIRIAEVRDSNAGYPEVCAGACRTGRVPTTPSTDRTGLELSRPLSVTRPVAASTMNIAVCQVCAACRPRFPSHPEWREARTFRGTRRAPPADPESTPSPEVRLLAAWRVV